MPSGIRPGKLRGREPVAMMTFFVLTFVSPLRPGHHGARPSRRPVPLNRVILFFLKVASMPFETG